MPLPSPLSAPPIPDVDLLSFLLDRPGTGYPADRIVFRTDNDDRYLTHSTLVHKVKQLGRGLNNLGVNDNDHVMVLAGHGLHYPVCLLGIICAGATCVPVNPALLVADIAKYIEATRAKFIIVGPEYIKTAEELSKLFDLEIVELVKTKFNAYDDLFKDVREWSREGKNKTAIIAFSSGTGGLPKGCEITQRNIVANTWITHYGTLKREKHDIVVGAFPPFHVAGIWGSMINPLFKGNTQILISQFDFGKFLGLIVKYKPTDLSTAPPIVLGLAMAPGLEKIDFSSVKRVACGAAPLSAELAEKCITRLRACGAKDVRLRQVWGMTETVCCATAFIDDTEDPYDAKAEALMAGSVGFPLPHLTIKLVDDGKEVRSGERGEILVKGPCVFKGYLPSTLPDNAQRSDYFTEDGYYRTGDIGVADAEGRLRIVDRIKELIKVSGFQVAPAELEGILLRSDLVADCAVIGVPPFHGASQDLIRKGEMVMAFVVPSSNLHPERIRKALFSWYNPQVVGYKRLSGGIRIVNAIPKCKIFSVHTDLSTVW